MNLVLIAILGIVLLVVLILWGVNIGMSMIITGFVGIWVAKGFDAAMGIIRTVPFNSGFSYTFTVIPLFVLMGELAFRSGISSSLYDTAEKWLASVPGGHAHATVAACAFFAAICGSNPATVATMGVVAYPEMKRFNYKDTLASGVITAGGTLGILIPPSTMMIVYGVVAEQSVGRLFAAGIVPGVLLALCYMGCVVIWVLHDPSAAPRGKKYSLKDKLISLKGMIGLIVLFVAVIGSIFTGFASATEAAAIGSFIALIIMIINRRFTWKALKASLIGTINTSAMTLFLVIGASVFGYFLTLTRVPQMLQEAVMSMNVNKFVLMTIIFLIYLFMGCIMDGLAMLMITVPIFMPVILDMGFDPIWFGVFIILVQNIGMMTPPVGLNVYITAGTLKEIPMQRIFKGAVPFVIAAIVCVAFVVVIPQLCTWLPDLIYGPLY